MHSTDTSSRERNTEHIKVQNAIYIHLKTVKSLIIISKEVSSIHTRTSKCASAHCKWPEASERFIEQFIVSKTLKCGLELHMSIKRVDIILSKIRFGMSSI